MGDRRREIIVAETAGFCFGVDRAVNGARQFFIDHDAVNCYTVGELIHNNYINNEMKRRGITIADDFRDIPDGANAVIRSHGVIPDVYEYFKEHNITYHDATCPFVEKIHKIVSDIPSEGSVLFIAGDEIHPEVIGICGYAKCPYYVVADENDFEKFKDKFNDLNVYLVSQTTFSYAKWQKCKEKLKNLFTNVYIFDTICKTTENRQNEALCLSRKCDLMIVIGSKHSSNSVKLSEICKENCKTIFIESANELSADDIIGFNTIGVTAGASTPPATIKEVLRTMSEVKETKVNVEEDFEAMLEESLNNMSTDQKVKGVIVGITPTEIQIDIGRKQTGYISYNEWSFDPTADPATEAKVGDEINVVIMKTNDAEGTIMCSKKRFDSANAWDELEAALESGNQVEGTVTDVIKGGVIATTAKGIRVFIPGSLTGVSRDEPMDSLLKTKVSFKIIEVVKQRRRAVGSIKAFTSNARREAQEKFWAEAEVGQVYTGVVKSLTNYGAFVDIGGVDGMIHISELSWKRIKNPAEVLAIGDTVEVYIKALDNNKISLGYKKEEDNPWAILKNTYDVGDVIDTKIVGMTTFGAFANVIDGIDGLIHISQIADRHIEKPQDALTNGEVVKVKITEIDYDKKRVSLSIRALIEPKEEETAPVEEEVAPVEEEAAPVEEAPAEE